MCGEQFHLGYKDTINYGSYYTPESVVDIAYGMIARNIPDWREHVIADTSCGYGNFLRFAGSIGADCDSAALLKAKSNTKNCKFVNHNSLLDVSRSLYGLSSEDKLIIIGNPPYNDTTSIIRNGIKESCLVDFDLKHRDLGISFLLSYDKLMADYICVLHPLSYLIKKTNFDGLGNFRNNYVLMDSIIISSGEFSATSKTTQFPIAIALYKRDNRGMSYESICERSWLTKEGKKFRINQFDKLSNYVTKYPNQKYVPREKATAFFWTMRDINALKRTRTFIENEVYNSIRVPREKLPFYCYADVFKEYIPHIPYYFGNSDVIIDYQAFNGLKDVFVRRSLRKYKFLNHLLPGECAYENDDATIHSYFNNLLGEHYVDKKN
ncbi:MAG: hypothetical protein LBT45_00950 [Rickettsiales bacterium]|jgi:hypothetical protein|nr:hypothetical protein [Rickettsiales bacterium]